MKKKGSPHLSGYLSFIDTNGSEQWIFEAEGVGSTKIKLVYYFITPEGMIRRIHSTGYYRQANEVIGHLARI